MAMPDPFYQIYASAAVAAGAQPHYLAATQDNGFIAPLDDLSEDVLARLRALYFAIRPIRKGRWPIRLISKRRLNWRSIMASS